MRMLAVYHKTDRVRFVSHLDVLRMLQRTFRRAGLPLKYSEGFNPHPEMSFASALATGMTSDAEWFEVELNSEMESEDFLFRINAALPEGFFLTDAQETPEGVKTLANLTRGAEYRIRAVMDREFSPEEVSVALEQMLSGDIIVEKRTKGGVKQVNIRPQILKAIVEGIEGNTITLLVLGRLQADGGLRAELMMRALFDRLDSHGSLRIHRCAMYFDPVGSLPRMPSE